MNESNEELIKTITWSLEKHPETWRLEQKPFHDAVLRNGPISITSSTLQYLPPENKKHEYFYRFSANEKQRISLVFQEAMLFLVKEKQEKDDKLKTKYNNEVIKILRKDKK